MPDFTYLGSIGNVEDTQAGVPIGDIRKLPNRVDTACLSRGIMVVHDRYRWWFRDIDNLQAAIAMGEKGVRTGYRY